MARELNFFKIFYIFLILFLSLYSSSDLQESVGGAILRLIVKRLPPPASEDAQILVFD